MAKKVAILAVNPVNGFGLFRYLEAFFENGIAYKVFAVAETTAIKTNSGISLQTDDVVANLKGAESEFDALVFACGNAMPKFSENAGRPEYRDLLTVIKTFGDKGKLIIGHCVGGLLFDIAGIASGRRLALHPFVKDAVKTAIATDEACVVDGNFYTAQSEACLLLLIPEVLKVLKQ
ncbi:MAG: DJ-1/PfpI family protein [Dysgonamonadaceae bacterium]|jgi:putative intracellular protease/amidase|nr:DJ-1/PfpI family protein [Dysgonamonadaceae bacterium]